MKLTIISPTRAIHDGVFISSVNSLQLNDIEVINSNPTGLDNSYIKSTIKQVSLKHTNFSREINNDLDRTLWYNDSGWYHKRILLPCIREVSDGDYILIAHEDVSFSIEDINYLKSFIGVESIIAASCAPVKSIDGIEKFGDRFLLIKKDAIHLFVSALMNCGNISKDTIITVNDYLKQYHPTKTIIITNLIK